MKSISNITMGKVLGDYSLGTIQKDSLLHLTNYFSAFIQRGYRNLLMSSFILSSGPIDSFTSHLHICNVFFFNTPLRTGDLDFVAVDKRMHCLSEIYENHLLSNPER